MKSYTSKEQAKKLVEFLPIESADMYYFLDPTPAGNIYHIVIPQIDFGVRTREPEYNEGDIPCWSLVALLNILPSSTLDSSDDHHYRVHCKEMFTDWYDNPIDCCVAMIDRLHKQMVYDFNNS
jgi:hypothetical protein